MNSTVSVSGVESGLKFEVVETAMGHRCGYVEIPEGHPLFGLAYSQNAPGKTMDDIKDEPIGKRGVLDIFTMAGRETPRVGDLFDVHGSLTFSGCRNSKTDFWLGFDCSHSGDAKDPTIMGERELALAERYGRFDGVMRTNDYVEAECRSLARQIAEKYPVEVSQ